MKKGIWGLLLIISLLTPMLASCYSAGKVAGEAVKGTKDAAQDLKRGYEEGKKGN